MAILGPGSDRPAALGPAAQRRTAKACFCVLREECRRLAAGEKSRRELLREGDRGSCRPSGPMSHSWMRWTRAMTELTAIIVATNAQCSIGKRRGSIKKKRRPRIHREHGKPNKPSEPDRIFRLGNDGADQNCSRDCALNTRDLDIIRSPIRSLRRCKRRARHSLIGRCQPRRSDGSWPAFGDGLASVIARVASISGPRTVRCAARI